MPEQLRAALEADVQIYTIIVDNGASGSAGNTVPFRPSMIQKPGDQGAARQGPSLLEELADKTGGLSFHVRSGAEAKEGRLQAGQALRNQYVIGYEPADSEPSGKLHRIRVKSTLPKVTVHARSSYYAPSAPLILRFLLHYVVAKDEADFADGPDLVIVQAQGTEDVALRVAAGVNPGNVSANEEASGLKGRRHSE